jgi:DNA-binding CsgD family transcriptional regulator
VLSSALLRDLARLTGEAHELRRTRTELRQHVLNRLAGLVHADAGVLAQSRDAGGGRQEIVGAVALNFDGVTHPAFDVLLERGGTFHPLVAVAVRQVGDGRHLIQAKRSDDLPRALWRESPYVRDFLGRSGLADSLISVQRFDTTEQMYGFGLFRERGRRGFSREDKLILELVEIGLGKLIHRDPAAPLLKLAPREREVLGCLLDGLCDKEIGQRLQITRNTVHEYVKRVFLAFDVHSRAELIALHLRADR